VWTAGSCSLFPGRTFKELERCRAGLYFGQGRWDTEEEGGKKKPTTICLRMAQAKKGNM